MPIPIPNYTITIYLLLVLLTPTHITSFNIIDTLSPFPDLSSFASLLDSISSDFSRRDYLTILVVPNNRLSLSSLPSPDSLRYHILLQYLTLTDLHAVPTNGKLITTLFQTTGRATENHGSVNVTFNPVTNAVTFHSQTSSASLLSQITTFPYNLSILTIDSILTPIVTDLTASETRPSINLNITKTLIEEGHSFHVAASMLSASGVGEEFENDEGGAGLTLFVPTDDAFANLPTSASFQSLPASKKAEVLKFHVLRSYYPLGSLESIVNPVQPTLATEEMGAGRFTLNISKINGSVAINTGIDQAMVTQTVFDQNPVAIFGISKVLLPREIFGDYPMVENSKPDVGAAAPNYSPGPTGSREEIRSSVASRGGGCVILWCIAFFVLV